MRHSAYEAWKNFMLVLAGVLASEMFSSLGEAGSFSKSIHDAIQYYISFDMWLWNVVKQVGIQFIIVFLVTIYFVKCMHGILVAIFSDHYYDQIKDSILKSMFGLFVSTLTIVFLTTAPWYARMAATQTKLELSSLAILGILLLPTVTFVALDFERLSRLSKMDRKMSIAWREKRFDDFFQLMFAHDKPSSAVVETWVVEDLILFAIGIVWATVIWLPWFGDDCKIVMTLIMLTAIPLVHGVLDYWANRSFYFKFWEPPKSGGEISHPEPGPEVSPKPRARRPQASPKTSPVGASAPKT